MRWVLRTGAFVLAMLVGVSVWQLLRHKRTSSAYASLAAASTTETRAWAANAPPAREPVGPSELMIPAPVAPIQGYAHRKVIALRESPDVNSGVLARLRVVEYEEVKILDYTRDFLRVKFAAETTLGEGREEEHEGWVEWGEVTPALSALVMDAEAGSVYRRVPLPSNFEAFSYSPDGGRVVFYGLPSDDRIACEARTEDYKFTRCLTVEWNNPGERSFFYGPADGALYVSTVVRNNYDPVPTKLTVTRVAAEDGTGAENVFKAEGAESFRVSPDGLTGFVLYSREKDGPRMDVDVVDLRSFEVRNRFTLHGRDLPLYDGGFLFSRDGSELYAKIDHDTNAVHVIDTQTGDVLRAMPYNFEGEYWNFSGRSYAGNSVVGGSVFVEAWDADAGEYDLPHGVWLGPDGRRLAPRDLKLAVEAGGTGYGVDRRGTRLYRLDEENRVRQQFAIGRPELKWGNSDLVPLLLGASPSGSHVIMFVGYEGGGC